MVLDKRYKYSYNRNIVKHSLATETASCPKRQQEVDKVTKYCYNKNKLANNVISDCCRNTTKKISKVVDKGVERHYT